MKSGQFSLLGQARFGPFFGAQFLGAFNDNLFKTALVTVITFDAASWTSMNVGLLNNLIAGLFILPFVLASATAGQLADKFDKAMYLSDVKTYSKQLSKLKYNMSNLHSVIWGQCSTSVKTKSRGCESTLSNPKP